MHVFRFSAPARPPSQSDETRSFHRNPIPILVNLIRQPHPVIPASQRSRQPSQSDSDSWSLLNKRPLRCLFRLLRCFVLRERAFHTCRAIPLSTRPLFSRELPAPRHSSRLRYRRQDRRRRDRSRHWYLRCRCRWRRHGWSSRRYPCACPWACLCQYGPCTTAGTQPHDCFQRNQLLIFCTSFNELSDGSGSQNRIACLGLSCTRWW